MTALHFARPIGRLALTLALVGMLAWPVSASAQAQASQPSLVELARLEAERRKTAKEAKKVITTKDLPESARKPASPPAVAAEGGAQAGGVQAGGAHSGGAHGGGEQKPAAGANSAPSAQGDETAWRARMTQAREGLRRNETFLQALQSRLNGLTNDFRNGGGNFPQQAQVNADREKTLQDMERVKADVELSKKQIADIEEEARKAGVPPGWLR